MERRSDYWNPVDNGAIPRQNPDRMTPASEAIFFGGVGND
jgi:hypothetical protein